MAIVRVCLKAFVECIRVQTFSRNAHHQIQVDVHFISTTLRPFARLDEEYVSAFTHSRLMLPFAVNLIDFWKTFWRLLWIDALMVRH